MHVFADLFITVSLCLYLKERFIHSQIVYVRGAIKNKRLRLIEVGRGEVHEVSMKKMLEV